MCALLPSLPRRGGGQPVSLVWPLAGVTSGTTSCPSLVGRHFQGGLPEQLALGGRDPLQGENNPSGGWGGGTQLPPCSQQDLGWLGAAMSMQEKL